MSVLLVTPPDAHAAGREQSLPGSAQAGPGELRRMLRRGLQGRGNKTRSASSIARMRRGEGEASAAQPAPVAACGRLAPAGPGSGGSAVGRGKAGDAPAPLWHLSALRSQSKHR